MKLPGSLNWVETFNGRLRLFDDVYISLIIHKANANY